MRAENHQRKVTDGYGLRLFNHARGLVGFMDFDIVASKRSRQNLNRVQEHCNEEPGHTGAPREIPWRHLLMDVLNGVSILLPIHIKRLFVDVPRLSVYAI